MGTFDWGDYVPDRLPGWIDDPASLALVCASDDDRAVAVSHTLMLSPTEAWLEGARVHPDFRRTGMGTAMNRAGVEWAREQGARVARLAIETDNVAAQRQVDGLGYRHTSSWVGAGLDPRQGSGTLERSTTAEADAAWLFWSGSDMARAGQELIARGWQWRKARPGDVTAAIDRGELFHCGAGWALVDQPNPGRLRVGWLATSREEAPTLLDGLLELAHTRAADELYLTAPKLEWVVETLAREGAETTEVMVYTLAVS
jgi:hypothetical protein